MARPLIAIIDGGGAMAALDEIVIDLYRKFKKLGKRASVAQRLLAHLRQGCAAWCLVRLVNIRPLSRMDVR